MPSPNPQTPGSPEFDAHQQNGGDGNRLGGGLARWIVKIAQSWVTRQALKMAAAASTIVCGYLVGNLHLSEDKATTIAAGAAALITGGVELALSYLNMKLAPKALPVDPTDT